MNEAKMSACTWSEAARQDSYMKMLIRKHGERFEVGDITDYITGKLAQTNIPECKNGPGKWLWTGWIQKI